MLPEDESFSGADRQLGAIAWFRFPGATRRDRSGSTGCSPPKIRPPASPIKSRYSRVLEQHGSLAAGRLRDKLFPDCHSSLGTFQHVMHWKRVADPMHLVWKASWCVRRGELPARELLTASITSYDGSCNTFGPRPSAFHPPTLQIAPTHPATSPLRLVLPCFG
jgi:hypothetical protein